jgi:hypothetical protein
MHDKLQLQNFLKNQPWKCEIPLLKLKRVKILTHIKLECIDCIAQAWLPINEDF